MKETEGIKNMTESEIAECARRLVEIKELHPEGTERIIYLLRIAGIDIRVYLSYVEVSQVANYMRRVVRKITNDKIGNVEILELKTEVNTYYLLRLAGFDIKAYLALEEATRVAKYMEDVVKKILE